MKEEHFCKPLTPDFRDELIGAIDNNIRALETFERNVFVNVQIYALQSQRKLINALPDGYPMPMTRMVD
ncbi:hypothetical protein B5F53_11515 [Blautia sp. An249]|uniref:hypothetical protein n=1 Tax=Blautia sp. An249 TaxID=1965603 RepID=UPI000B3A795C|nr:hypothetical protein [Blautia sp. An249]OUO78169.1 hypothetical protein B5F53_11515 [Blautia sp. An249]